MLADDIRNCTRCPLWEKQEPGAKHVPGVIGSNYRPRGLAILADHPRYYEAKSGVPFQGPTGGLLDTLLQHVGLTRDDLMITHGVRCRPPGNRIVDYPEAVVTCDSWTADEMAAYDPSVIVLMGREALQSIFGKEASVGATRGALTALPAKHSWRAGGGTRLCLPTYAPAAASFGGGLDSEPGQAIIEDLKAAVATAAAMREVI